MIFTSHFFSNPKIISEIILEKIVQNRTNFLKIFYSIFDSNKSKIKFILQKLRIIRLKKNKKEIKLSEVVSMIQRLNNINSKKISCSSSALTKSIRIFEKA